jgi:FkbM family methyltransferase
MHDPLQNFIMKNKCSGLLVEPQISMLNKCKIRYKNIQNLEYLNAAIYSKKKKIKLYKVNKALDYSHTGWASVIGSRFENTIYKKDFSYEIVEGVPLNDILIKYNIKQLDLLQIDTEGYDFEILKLFNFDCLQPKLIQLEHSHLKKNEIFDATRLLIENNYFVLKKKNDLVCIRKNYINLIYSIAYFSLRFSESLKSRLGWNK